MREIKSTTTSEEIWGSEEFIQLFDGFRFASKASISFDFDDPSSMSDDDYVNLTGVNKGNNRLSLSLKTYRDFPRRRRCHIHVVVLQRGYNFTGVCVK